MASPDPPTPTDGTPDVSTAASDTAYDPEPKALDTSFLRKFREGDRDPILAEWELLADELDGLTIPDGAKFPAAEPISKELETLVAEGKALCQSKLEGKDEEGSLNDPATMAEYIGQIARIAHDKASEPLLSSLGDVFPDNSKLDFWVRQQLQDQWAVKYKAVRRERTVLQARMMSAQAMENREEIERVRAEKQKLQRQVFDECVGVLVDTFAEPHRAIEICLDEIETLNRLYNDQLKILIENEATPNEVIVETVLRNEEVSDMLTPMFEKLERAIDEIESSLSKADRASQRLITRANRLSANDVETPRGRVEEFNRRLRDPHAHLYMLKAMEDLCDIPEEIQPALQIVKTFEEELASIQRISVGLFSEIRSVAP